MTSDKFGSQLDEKVKRGFLLSLMCMFLNRTRQNSDPTGYGQTAKNEQKDDLTYSFNQLSCLKWLF